MKKIIALLICIFPIILKSQSKLDFSVSLDYSYRNLTSSNVFHLDRASEIGKLNYHFNINYNQKLNEKIWFRAGLGFSSVGYKNNEQTFYSEGFYRTPNGGVFIQSLRIVDGIKVNHHFFEVPVMIRYEFSQNKITPFIEFGLSTMYYLQTSAILLSEEEKSSVIRKRLDFISQIQFASIFSFGINYILSEKWELIVQPNFRYHLNNHFYKLESDKQYLWSIGLALGVRMKLK